MAATEILRIRVEPEVKEALTKLYKAQGTTVSQAVRGFLSDELAKQSSALDRFDAIMASADEKTKSSGQSEPVIDDIVAYIEKVRCERQADASLVS